MADFRRHVEALTLGLFAYGVEGFPAGLFERSLKALYLVDVFVARVGAVDVFVDDEQKLNLRVVAFGSVDGVVDRSTPTLVSVGSRIRSSIE